ncbi:17064_t:CDS:2, partial [Cetraspora pellucida]
MAPVYSRLSFHLALPNIIVEATDHANETIASVLKSQLTAQALHIVNIYSVLQSCMNLKTSLI